ncbi:MAG: hypothetical protein IT431_04445 [Phycisphaerales bacterium]|nr:hypothetical protein [Phycisphaerales bacterium]
MGSSVVLIVALVILADLVIVPLIVMAVVSGTWSPLADRYPAQALGADAVRRDFQSYKVGIMNLGFSIHTAVDERHLHLLPAMLGRWMRMRPVSVPWEAVEPVRRRGAKYAEVRIGKETVVGPAWALGLAFGDSAGGPGEHDV